MVLSGLDEAIGCKKEGKKSSIKILTTAAWYTRYIGIFFTNFLLKSQNFSLLLCRRYHQIVGGNVGRNLGPYFI